jgi:hypothetical protein
MKTQAFLDFSVFVYLLFPEGILVVLLVAVTYYSMIWKWPGTVQHFEFYSIFIPLF